MKLNVTNPINWTPKPGIYRGTIEYAGQYKGPTQARIVVALDFDNGSGYAYKVHRVYPAQLHPGSDLHRDIESIMGPGSLARMKQFDLEELVGTKVVVNVVAIKSKEYQKPLITYNAIHPDQKAAPPEEPEPEFPSPLFERDEEYSGPIEMNLRKLQEHIVELDRRRNERP